MRATEENFGALRTVRRCINGLAAEHVSLIAGTKKAEAQHDILVSHFCKSKFAAPTCHGELCIIVQGMWSLKTRVAIGRD